MKDNSVIHESILSAAVSLGVIAQRLLCLLKVTAIRRCGQQYVTEMIAVCVQEHAALQTSAGLIKELKRLSHYHVRPPTIMTH